MVFFLLLIFAYGKLTEICCNFLACCFPLHLVGNCLCLLLILIFNKVKCREPLHASGHRRVVFSVLSTPLNSNSFRVGSLFSCVSSRNYNSWKMTGWPVFFQAETMSFFSSFSQPSEQKKTYRYPPQHLPLSVEKKKQLRPLFHEYGGHQTVKYNHH